MFANLINPVNLSGSGNSSLRFNLRLFSYYENDLNNLLVFEKIDAN